MSIHRLSLSISYLIQSLEEEEQKLGPTKENPHFETPNAIQCHGMEPMTNILIKLSYWMYLEASLRFNCPIPEPVSLLISYALHPQKQHKISPSNVSVFSKLTTQNIPPFERALH